VVHLGTRNRPYLFTLMEMVIALDTIFATKLQIPQARIELENARKEVSALFLEEVHRQVNSNLITSIVFRLDSLYILNVTVMIDKVDDWDTIEEFNIGSYYVEHSLLYGGERKLRHEDGVKIQSLITEFNNHLQEA
jgi:hypothetical protein